MLYQLSYASQLERETGIGPATNSLEGCDSTTELLPRSIYCRRYLRGGSNGGLALTTTGSRLSRLARECVLADRFPQPAK